MRPVTGYVAAVCGIFGLVIGSFLNVVIWRVPRQESVVSPPSRCPACGTRIRPHENVPVVSWLALRGRCRHCGVGIPVRYPLVEAGTGALFAVFGARFSDSWVLPAYLLLAAGLVAISLIDLDHLVIPNRIVYPLGFASGALLLLASGATHDWWAAARAGAGGLAYFGVFYGLWFAAPKAMGFGDVRLAAVLGLHLGWLGWSPLTLGMFLPFLVGSLAGIVAVAPWLLAPMGGAAAAAWAKGVEWFESATGAEPSDPTRARLAVAGGAAVLVGAALYLVLSALRRIPRGRAIPFGPSMAVGALLALLAVGPPA